MNTQRFSLQPSLTTSTCENSLRILLIQIMRDKAAELNKCFKSDNWTPRKIDKVLWCVDR